MQEWILIGLYALFVQIARTLYEKHTGESKKMKELRDNIKDASEDEMVNILKTMNKMLLRRTLFFIIIFLPIYYLFAGSGDIPTPVGNIHWMVWYIIMLVLAGGVIGGILRAKAHAKSEG